MLGFDALSTAPLAALAGTSAPEPVPVPVLDPTYHFFADISPTRYRALYDPGVLLPGASAFRAVTPSATRFTAVLEDVYDDDD